MKLKLAGLLLVAGTAMFGQGNFGPGPRPTPGYTGQRPNFRPELRKFYERADKLRAKIDEDRFRIREAQARRDFRAVNRFTDRLNRDQRDLNVLLADIDRREGRFQNRRFDSFR
jgi:uncharacterized coiled-coil DUF342 family protein